MKAADVNHTFLLDEDEADVTKPDVPASEAILDAVISRPDQTDSSMVRSTFGRARLSSCSPKPKTVYQNIISAVTLSLLYALTCSGRYTPLSNRSFITFNGFHSYAEDDDDLISTEVDNCSEFLLHVQWLRDGTLVLFVSLREDFCWSSMSSDLSRSVTFSPMGISALFQSFANEPRHSSGVASHGIRNVDQGNISRDHPELSYYKEVVRDFLRLRGFTMPEQTDWVWLSVVIFEDGEEEISRPEDPRKLLWPVQLCFQQTTTKLSNSDDSFYLWGGANLATIDPLAEAEQWFMSRESRERAEQEFQRLQEEKLNSTRHRDSSDDDSISDINPIIDSQQENQGMSGIYPTPPDGFNPYTVTPSADNAMTTSVQSANDPVTRAGEVEDKVPLAKGETHVLMPDDEFRLGEYNNDDLFDEFNANGLTEADFNFFDQPDDDYVPDAAAVGGGQGTNPAAPHAESHGDGEASMQKDHNGHTSDNPHGEIAGEFTSQAILIGAL